MKLITIPWLKDSTFTVMRHGFEAGDQIAISIANPSWWRRALASIGIRRFLMHSYRVSYVEDSNTFTVGPK